jgi:hypothetical protein
MTAPPCPSTSPVDAAGAAEKASTGRCMCGGLQVLRPEGPRHRPRAGDLVMGDPNFRLRVDFGIEL